jgi:hypothetical protein
LNRATRRAEVIAALRDPSMACRSDRELARKLGVSHTAIGNFRRGLATCQAGVQEVSTQGGAGKFPEGVDLDWQVSTLPRGKFRGIAAIARALRVASIEGGAA